MKARSIRLGSTSVVAAASLFAALALSRPVAAQQLSAFQYIGAGDGDTTYATLNRSGDNFAGNPLTGTLTFTGLDSQGNTQTMTFDATTYSSAQYGRLHAYGSGTITNPYYNPANTPYYDTPTSTFDPDGSPKVPVVSGLASFQDSLLYTGLQGTGYKVNYLFHIDGTSSGPGSAVLDFRASDSATTEVFQTGFTPGSDWATDFHDVAWGVPTNIDALFFAGFGADLSQYPEGQTITGLADYSATLVLVGIQVEDQNNNLVSGWSVTAASGTSYPLQQAPASVPEPGGTTLLIGAVSVGALFGLRRRQLRNRILPGG